MLQPISPLHISAVHQSEITMREADLTRKIISGNNVVIVHPYLPSEIEVPTFGGTRLIAEQARFFKQEGYEVQLISIADIGSATSLVYRWQGHFRSRAKDQSTKDGIQSSEDKRWRFNLLQVLINHYLARMDVFYRYAVNNLLKSLARESTIVYHYPFGGKYFASVAKKHLLKMILYEHNIEWRFFSERLDKSFLGKTLASWIKRIEIECMKASDVVVFASDLDRLVVSKESESTKMNTITWLPITSPSIMAISNEICETIRQAGRGRTIVGFLGTSFSPNISAVENIINLASASNGTLYFLIMGSVNQAFKNYKDIPENIMFTGYVDNLDSYLACCDLFINPKTTSDTGVETKMFDYMKFNKYIIATDIGARGFESYDKLIITELENMQQVISTMRV